MATQPLSPHRVVIIVLVISFLLAGCASQSVATPPPQHARDAGLEQTILQQLELINPAAVPIFQQATTAGDADDFEKSKELYEQVLVLAPGFSPTYRRLAGIELVLNHVDRAVELARIAVELEPNAYNQSTLAYSLLGKKTPRDDQEAFTLASTAIQSLPNDQFANQVLLRAALMVHNLDIARQVDDRLLKMAPLDPTVHYFAGVIAAMDEKWEKSEAELLYSKRLGGDPKSIQTVLDLGVSRNARVMHFLRWGGISMLLWLLGLGLLFLAGTFLSRATLRSLNKTETIDLQVKPEERKIRSIYRWVITILSLYFYISIPFVILLLFLVVGGVFYIFSSIGAFPVQLSLVLVVMLVASLFAILRALFTRIKVVIPGRKLERVDAPELWQLVEQVAHKLEEQPVDAIYITPWVEIAVMERGSILQKLRGRGERHLLVGMGALSELTQGQLAAVLAHEYGHFSNRDTAGGDLAHQVNASLTQMAYRLGQGRARQIFNPVWLFLVGYGRIFLRVTRGASRLQEALADRYATLAYGGRNLIEGLKSIIRQTIAFQLTANNELRQSLNLDRPVSNLYQIPVEAELQGELDQRLSQTMSRTTSQYDSHPAPQERIAWIERIGLPDSSMQDDPRPALQLLPDAEAMQQEMTAQILKSVKKK